jgi:site-specific recombinase XerD
MKKLDGSLFFSMTRDYLEKYIPQDHDSKKTIQSYKDGLTIFRRYVCDEKNLSVGKFTFDDCTFEFVLDYRNWLLENQHRVPSTVNHRLAVIRSYLSYAAARNISLQQINLSIEEVPFLKVPKQIRQIIEEEDALKAFLDAPSNTRIGVRDTMILSLLFDTAIRANELIHLDLRDINLKSEVPFVFIHGKGNKERAVPMTEGTIRLVMAYIAEYHNKRKDYDYPFVYTVIHGENHRMSERNLERIVKKYADVVRNDFPSLPKSVYPHLLRRTRATGLYRDGVDIELIASTLGHASIQTTKDHYAYPSLEQKREAMEKGKAGTLSSPDEKQKWPYNEDELARLCGLR